MKKYCSVFSLFYHSSFWKICLVLFLMTAAEILLFLRQCSVCAAIDSWDRFETLLDYSQADLIFAGAFLVTTFQLCRIGIHRSSRTILTLHRLSIPETHYYFLQVTYHVLIYLFLWSLQVGLAYGFGLYYLSKAPDSLINSQTLFLAFYRSPFLHGLLPLAEIPLWIRNMITIAGLSFASAIVSYKQRRGRLHIAILPLALISIYFFPGRIIGDLASSMVPILASLLVIGLIFFDFYYWEDSYDG